MVAMDGGCFGMPIKGYHGVAQGDPLSPTVFNVVGDAIIRHWVTLVAPTEDGWEGLGHVDSVLGGLLIFQQWHQCVNSAGEPTEDL